jgi:hypothetical protein
LTFQIWRGGEKSFGRRGRLLEEFSWIVVGRRWAGDATDVRFGEAEKCTSRLFGLETEGVNLR